MPIPWPPPKFLGLGQIDDKLLLYLQMKTDGCFVITGLQSDQTRSLCSLSKAAEAHGWGCCRGKGLRKVGLHRPQAQGHMVGPR